MDRERFDALTRQLACRGSRRAALGALAGAVLLVRDAAPLLAHRRKRRRRHKQKKRTPATVVVCQNGETFPVPESAVQGILLAGGTVGPCPTSAGVGAGGGSVPGTCLPGGTTQHPFCQCFRISNITPCTAVVPCQTFGAFCLPERGRCECAN
jgi:hypothetical protein